MASKAVTIGDLIHRVASSCLSNRFPGNYAHHGSDLDDDDDDDPFADFGDAATHEECPRPALAKHALEAHATAVLLGGFEHESFYLDGSLSSLLDPAAFRRERYAQFRDMRGMDPGELLGVLPTCAFGRP
ncbi:hypothetical protein TRIUR3_11999 [Triticum urartu]|uniref:Uncharacterized protein n=1 Tax=Triticum urartu TaxID=4572 RepID=M7ZTJ6_TRIUA|nr:hypothetical protein TRIUR3_11999 [Triticum urartu]